MSASRPSQEPRAVAERVARSLADKGARAVALVGSHARGHAYADSDLDFAVIGEGPHYRLETHGGWLISLGWARAEEQRQRLYEPSYLGTHVPGWREALVLHDPEGLAASIQREALEWSWNLVEDRCSAWIAEGITGYAEEAQRLAASLRAGRKTTAAVQRSVLALRLPRILALHLRILYGTENELWDLVADELGAPWRDAQSAALGLGGESLDASCRAALTLFALAATEVRSHLDDDQLAVVEHVLRRVRPESS